MWAGRVGWRALRPEVWLQQKTAIVSALIEEVAEAVVLLWPGTH